MANQFFQQALTLTREIETLSNDLIEINDQHEAVKTEIDIRKAQIMQAVADEIVPETGKAKFSNEVSRNAEQALRCAVDTDLVSCRSDLMALTAQKIRKTNAIEKAKNQLAVYRSFAPVLTEVSA